MQMIIKINMLSERSQRHTHKHRFAFLENSKEYQITYVGVRKLKSAFPGLGGMRLKEEGGRTTKEPKDSFELDRYAHHPD